MATEPTDLSGLPASLEEPNEAAGPDVRIEGLSAGLHGLLGERCGLGRSVPIEVVQQLGEGAQQLMERGLLTRAEDGGLTVPAPVYAFVQAELGHEDEAQYIGGAVVHLLKKLPADHPVRLKVEQQIRLRE